MVSDTLSTQNAQQFHKERIQHAAIHDAPNEII